MAMFYDWNKLLSQNVRELKYSGEPACKQIQEEEGLSDIIFKLKTLNFLEISKTPITVFPDSVAALENLTNLVLRDNKLTLIPTSIGKLTKLKFVDVSNNLIGKNFLSICMVEISN